MTIHNQNLLNSLSSCATSLFKNSLIPNITASQKKNLAIVALVSLSFCFLAACYLLVRDRVSIFKTKMKKLDDLKDQTIKKVDDLNGAAKTKFFSVIFKNSPNLTEAAPVEGQKTSKVEVESVKATPVRGKKISEAEAESDSVKTALAESENVSKLNKKYTVRLINAADYPNQEEAIREVANIASQTGLTGSERYLSKEYQGEKNYHTLLAVKDNKIVGFLSGEIQNDVNIRELKNTKADRFYVHRVAVNNDFRSEANNRSQEKVGTRLILQAMEKTKELGKAFLSLEYDPGTVRDKYYRGDYRKGCERRVSFYENFEKKFNIPAFYADDVFCGEEFDDVEVNRHLTYDVQHFEYENALNIIG